MDGHTPEGGWLVTLELTADQLEMLIRGIETATMMSGSGKSLAGQKHDAAAAADYTKFLKELLELLRAALEEHRPK